MIRPTLFLLLAAAAPAVEAGKSIFPDRHGQPGAELAVRGAGTLWWRGIFAIYDAALWLDAARPDADPLGDDVARRLEFRLRRDLSQATLVEATTATFGQGLTEAERQALAGALAELNRQYRDLRRGEAIAYTYRPGAGTVVEVGGVAGAPIPGAAFARALFAIWLGPSPVDTGFRAALLARP